MKCIIHTSEQQQTADKNQRATWQGEQENCNVQMRLQLCKQWTHSSGGGGGGAGSGGDVMD